MGGYPGDQIGTQGRRAKGGVKGGHGGACVGRLPLLCCVLPNGVEERVRGSSCRSATRVAAQGALRHPERAPDAHRTGVSSRARLLCRGVQLCQHHPASNSGGLPICGGISRPPESRVSRGLGRRATAPRNNNRINNDNKKKKKSNNNNNNEDNTNKQTNKK